MNNTILTYEIATQRNAALIEQASRARLAKNLRRVRGHKTPDKPHSRSAVSRSGETPMT